MSNSTSSTEGVKHTAGPCGEAMTRANIYTTRAGIQIGAHYIPPAPKELGSEAERIQAALLAKQKSGYPRGWWLIVGICGAAGVLITVLT